MLAVAVLACHVSQCGAGRAGGDSDWCAHNTEEGSARDGENDQFVFFSFYEHRHRYIARRLVLVATGHE